MKGFYLCAFHTELYSTVFSDSVFWASLLDGKTGSRTNKFVCISGNEWVNLVGGENYHVLNISVEKQPTTIFCSAFSHKERQSYLKLSFQRKSTKATNFISASNRKQTTLQKISVFTIDWKIHLSCRWKCRRSLILLVKDHTTFTVLVPLALFHHFGCFSSWFLRISHCTTTLCCMSRLPPVAPYSHAVSKTPVHALVIFQFYLS